MSRPTWDPVVRADRWLFARAATLEHRTADRVLPALSRAADHGLLWTGTAALLAATGPRGRRAATRGLVSMGLASAIANGPVKYLFRRQRPSIDLVPPLRLLPRQPRTTSFPSGHAASAAAFATGVAMECPAAAPLVGTIAAAVAYSRVHVGVHYPADVLVGAGLGAGAALVVRSRWPVRPGRAGAAAADAAAAPALPDGAGLVAVVNALAGTAGDGVTSAVRSALPAAEVVECDDPDTLAEVMEGAARRARVLGVAGGDGTLTCAATAALRHDLPLAVFPAGTLNHFAADLGVGDVHAVADAVRRGQAVEVSVGSADPDGASAYFLNTFSLGLYPELVTLRERRERWLGKWLALAVSLVEALHHARPLDVEVDGRRRRLWLLFGGNGRYHPDGFAPSWRERLDEGRVDVRLVDAQRPLARTRLVAAVLSGRLGRCRVYEQQLTDRMSIRLLDGDERLARDGEVERAPERLVLAPAGRRLTVYRAEAG